MEYRDAQVAELKRIQRNQKYNDIKEGIFVGDSFVRFSAREVLDGIECQIPEDFIEMPEAVQVMKYPSSGRPQRIFTSLDSCVNFAFSILQESTPGEQLEDLAAGLREMLHVSNPSILFDQEKSEELWDKKRIHMFDFKSFGVDGQIYHMMCFAALGAGILHGTFNCLEEDAELWKEAAWQVFQTIQPQKGRE